MDVDGLFENVLMDNFPDNDKNYENLCLAFDKMYVDMKDLDKDTGNPLAQAQFEPVEDIPNEVKNLILHHNI